MSPMTRYTFMISSELQEGLRALKARDGISEGEAIRRAVATFLEKRGIASKSQKPERKRAATRRRP